MTELGEVEVLLVGQETDANDDLEATVRLAGVPRRGDEITVWQGDREGEVFVEVERVIWPAWQYDHDPGVLTPKVLLRRAGGFTDDEWRDVFAAVKEGRHP